MHQNQFVCRNSRPHRIPQPEEFTSAAAISASGLWSRHTVTKNCNKPCESKRQRAQEQKCPTFFWTPTFFFGEKGKAQWSNLQVSFFFEAYPKTLLKPDAPQIPLGFCGRISSSHAASVCSRGSPSGENHKFGAKIRWKLQPWGVQLGLPMVSGHIRPPTINLWLLKHPKNSWRDRKVYNCRIWYFKNAVAICFWP